MAISQLGSVLQVNYSYNVGNGNIDVTFNNVTIPAITINSAWSNTATEIKTIATNPYAVLRTQGVTTPTTNLIFNGQTTMSKSQWRSRVNSYLCPSCPSQPTVYYEGYQYNPSNPTQNQTTTVATEYSVNNSVPLIPNPATFNYINEICYSGSPAVKINITSSATSVDNFKVYRATSSGGTYTLIGTIYTSGGTPYEFYDNTCNAQQYYFYKASACNVAWEEFSTYQKIEIKPPAITGLTGTHVTTEYPLLKYTGETETLCGSQLVIYIDGVQVGTSATNTFSGYLTCPNTNYNLTVIQSGGTGQLSDVSNSVVLNYPISLSGTPVLTNDGYAITANTISLSWTDVNTGNNKTLLYRSENNAAYTLLQTFTEFPKFNLTHLYELNSVSGSTAIDSVGAINGLMSNGNFTNDGILGYCATLNTDGVLNLYQSYNFQYNEAFTLNFWCKNLETNQNLCSKGNSQYTTFYLEGEKPAFYLTSYLTQLEIIGIRTVNNINLSSWNLMSFQYDGSGLASGMKIYVNGVLQSVVTTYNANLTTPFVNTNNFTFNKSQTTQVKYDQISIFNKVLSSTDIGFIYNSGIGTSYSPILSYTDAALSYDKNYKYKVVDTIDYWPCPVYSSYSNIISQNTLHIPTAPTNLNFTSISYNTATLNWTNTNVSGVTGNYVQLYDVTGATWNTIATLASGATSYNLTGLVPSSQYIYRVVAYNQLFETASNSAVLNTLLLPPPVITGTSASHTWIRVNWTNGYAYDYIRIRYTSNKNSGSQLITPTTSTSFKIVDLYPDTTYSIYLEVGVWTGLGYGINYSNTVQVTTLDYLSPFCDAVNYTVNDATCGNSDGSIVITNSGYTELYTFTLEDVFGNIYPISGSSFINLPASYYTLTAIVVWKNVGYGTIVYYGFKSVYGNEPCIINWIPLEDSDTTITLLDTKIKPAVCQGFGGAKGRIVYQFDDSSAATGWTFSLYNERFELVSTQILTDISSIQYAASADIYYGILENNLGCTYLIDLTQVGSENLYSVEGIKRLFLTPWSATTIYNYYSSSDEDWYVQTYDQLSYNSTKIKEFINLPDFWYEIKLDTATMGYTQNLQRGSQGLVYQEAVNVIIPSADSEKWKELGNILIGRYTIVFQDNNDNYFCVGYQNGTTVKSYSLSENQYAISFINPTNKMLTSIAKEYVKLAIL